MCNGGACGDPRLVPCLRLLDADGSPCEINKSAVDAGRSCGALASCDTSTQCRWLDSRGVRETLLLLAGSQRQQPRAWLLHTPARGLSLGWTGLLAVCES